MGPTKNLSYLLYHLSQVMDKQSETLLKKQLGIGLSQYRILAVLDWNPMVQQNSIAASLGQSEAAISRQIKILKEQGLVQIEFDPMNRRKHIARPTAKGAKLTEEATAIIRRQMNKDYQYLTDHDLAELMNSLVHLHKMVCRPGGIGACDHPLGV